MIIEAILKINPSAKVTVNADDINQITCMKEQHQSLKLTWSTISAVEFDMAMENLRAKRNKDLQDLDWTQLSDNTLTNDQRQAYMRYRTELRNITDGLTTVEQVNNIDYPDKPNG